MAVNYTIARGTVFDVTTGDKIDALETVRVDRHRKADSCVSVSITTTSGEIVAQVGRFFHGCALPYDFEDVSTFIEECEDKARATSADPRGRFLCYPEKFTTDTDGTLALIARLAR